MDFTWPNLVLAANYYWAGSLVPVIIAILFTQ